MTTTPPDIRGMLAATIRHAEEAGDMRASVEIRNALLRMENPGDGDGDAPGDGDDPWAGAARKWEPDPTFGAPGVLPLLTPPELADVLRQHCTPGQLRMVARILMDESTAALHAALDGAQREQDATAYRLAYNALYPAGNPSQGPPF